jgi:hypothetical protein
MRYVVTTAPHGAHIFYQTDNEENCTMVKSCFLCDLVDELRALDDTVVYVYKNDISLGFAELIQEAGLEIMFME